MGFKDDTSFLRFLSMGAAGARQAIIYLRSKGFEPIELERYCTSNKIWATKVKRLRLPDLLCVRTGMRVEVRAKSDLRIRMSDAPTRPDRRWDGGLRDDDLVALIACSEDNGTPVPAAKPVFFAIGDLRASVGTSKLGQAKSAAEGAERDRIWPSIVPSRSGVVQEVDAVRLRVLMDAESGRQPRSQSYPLQKLKDAIGLNENPSERKTAYIGVGERFIGGASMLAGTPRQQARLKPYLQNAYDPLAELASPSDMDRYAAAKSLPYRSDVQGRLAAIEQHLDVETEARVLLETAGAGTALGSQKSSDRLEGILWNHDRADLQMEVVLILTELRDANARGLLSRIATDRRF
jgi:hypothetical protein